MKWLKIWHVNLTGKFIIGGPDGDAVLKGCEIIVYDYFRAASQGCQFRWGWTDLVDALKTAE